MKGAILLLMLVTLAARAQQQPTLSDLQPAPAVDSSTLTEVQSLIDAGRFHEAEGALRPYLAENDLSAEAHAMLGYALLRQDEPRESLKEYNRSAALETPTATMLESVGQDYVLLGDWNDADRWTLRAVEMDPKDADAWYSLGRIRYSEQRFRDALSCFQRALVLLPRSVKAENNLGLTEEALNQTDAAVVAYRQAIAWQEARPAGSMSEQPLLNLGIVLLHRGDLAGAEPLLKKAAVLAPKDSHIHEQLGHLYLQRGDFGSAQRELQQACRLDPGNSGLHFLLGQAYRRLGRQQEAKAEFATSKQLANAAATPNVP
ncbi:MAG TPA: tetratricopeptide repeat protein [Acidobacteriaceae bacterium]|nr:tetratricopeptide repeat protein [Acidobacteriaceae bacterium]